LSDSLPTEKISPFDRVEWEKRSALIGNEKGVTIFRQDDVEVPKGLVADGDQYRRQQIFSRKTGKRASAKDRCAN